MNCDIVIMIASGDAASPTIAAFASKLLLGPKMFGMDVSIPTGAWCRYNCEAQKARHFVHYFTNFSKAKITHLFVFLTYPEARVHRHCQKEQCQIEHRKFIRLER